MTETPGKRMLVIGDPLWAKVLQYVHYQTEQQSRRVTNSEVVRVCLDLFFDTLALLKKTKASTHPFVVCEFIRQAVIEKLERDRP